MVVQGNRTGTSVGVIIPFFDPKAEYFDFIVRLLDSLVIQTVQPLEVIFSTNHLVTYENEISRKYGSRLAIIFILNESEGAAENINIAVSQSKADIIKLIFQDDFLVDENTLARCVGLGQQFSWQLFSFVDSNKNGEIVGSNSYPVVNPILKYGINTVGAPSIVAFRRQAYVEMDERLKYVFDCDWYLRMLHKNGFPDYESNPSVAIRSHEGQATHWAKRLKSKETRLMKRSHPWSFGRQCHCSRSQTP